MMAANIIHNSKSMIGPNIPIKAKTWLAIKGKE